MDTTALEELLDEMFSSLEDIETKAAAAIRFPRGAFPGRGVTECGLLRRQDWLTPATVLVDFMECLQVRIGDPDYGATTMGELRLVRQAEGGAPLAQTTCRTRRRRL